MIDTGNRTLGAKLFGVSARSRRPARILVVADCRSANWWTDHMLPEICHLLGEYTEARPVRVQRRQYPDGVSNGL